jgi:hypothetical protein
VTVATSPRARLAGSPLARAGGLAVVRLAGADLIDRLRLEAHEVHRAATEARTADFDDDERGSPDRWLESAPGGAALRCFMHDPRTLAALAAIAGQQCVPLGSDGSYSYYRRPGHHLGLHRDIHGCDVAAITCVDLAGGGGGGELEIFPGQADAPLGASRGSVPGRTVALAPGDTAVLLGSVVPHRLTPIAGDRVRIVAPLCYTLVG